MGRSPLEGLTVIDFTRVRAGPWCTQLLEALGADVIKIERPGAGDLTRTTEPTQGGLGADFISKNRNKKSVEVNLKSEEGREIAERLIADADVLVENFSVGVMDSLGLGYEYLSTTVNPQLVYASITGYGETGPYRDKRGVDLVLQAEAGLMSVTGPEGGPPVKVGQAIGDIGAGLYATIAILTALHDRHVTGTGQKVSTDLFGTIMSFLDEYITMYGMTGENPEPRGTRHQSGVPYELFETKDGHLVLSAFGGGWETFVTEIIEDESILEYDTNEARREHYDEIMAVMRPKMKEKTTEAWIECLEAHGFPCGPLNRVGDVIEHPQAEDRGYVSTLEDESIGDVLVPGYPLHFSDAGQSDDRAVPALGEHTEEVLVDMLGVSADRIEELRANGAIG